MELDFWVFSWLLGRYVDSVFFSLFLWHCLGMLGDC